MEEEKPRFPDRNVLSAYVILNILDKEYRFLDMWHFVTWKALKNEAFLSHEKETLKKKKLQYIKCLFKPLELPCIWCYECHLALGSLVNDTIRNQY